MDPRTSRSAARTAPPHTRGWTPERRAGARTLHGSPAHAGMDPACGSAWRTRGWLPRTRGDGPGGDGHILVTSGAPPHTRGWTRRRPSTRSSPRGSPAHAGMNPGFPTAPRFVTRLPRTRGDGPYRVMLKNRARLAPPHTRGWTFPRRPRPSDVPGSPAHAGMDPTPRRRARGTSRLPRTRGDGPGRLCRRECVLAAPPHTRGWTLADGLLVDGA